MCREIDMTECQCAAKESDVSPTLLAPQLASMKAREAPLVEGRADAEAATDSEPEAEVAPVSPAPPARQRSVGGKQKSWFGFGGKELETFSIEEVARHDQPHDCWVVAHGVVYDATPFLDVHPGGPCILKRGGRDATRDFDFHSRDGRKAWNELRIGRLEGAGSCSVM
eukprot:TRINITY_DN13737_c0_g1_i1.p2 TRINITY_DN13737_c0_g1~~TRINITY_DN13737_c0_g1_i1.p2  ORF type:complete len:168 (-),score=32.04 TRINITY_DN13737_c0_g1_i1:81-584(-)